MIIQTLERTLRATVACVEETSGWRPTEMEVRQVAEHSYRFPLVAAAHYQGCDLWRLVVGCERELARRTAGLNRHVEPASGDVQKLEEEGFRLLCTSLQRALASNGGCDQPPFLIQDPDTFHTHARGARCFLMRIATPAGSLRLLVKLVGRETLVGGESPDPCSFKTVEQPSGATLEASGIADPGGVRPILRVLARLEEDVYLRLNERQGETAAFPGSILDRADDLPDRGALWLTSVCLGQGKEVGLPGSEVVVLFFHEGRLRQFSSTIVRVASLPLAGMTCLPVLEVCAPARIAPGQRRAAFRVQPARKVQGTIRCKERGKEKDSRGRRKIPFEVQDLSFTGAKVEIRSETLLSQLKWGQEIDCAITLPEPFGPVELVAVVHRLELDSGQRQQPVRLGIEFIRNASGEVGALATIRRFVLEQERQSLRRRQKWAVR